MPQSTWRPSLVSLLLPSGHRSEPYILSLPYLDVTQCVTSPSYSGYVLNNCNNNVWQLYWFIPVTS